MLPGILPIGSPQQDSCREDWSAKQTTYISQKDQRPYVCAPDQPTQAYSTPRHQNLAAPMQHRPERPQHRLAHGIGCHPGTCWGQLTGHSRYLSGDFHMGSPACPGPPHTRSGPDRQRMGAGRHVDPVLSGHRPGPPAGDVDGNTAQPTPGPDTDACGNRRGDRPHRHILGHQSLRPYRTTGLGHTDCNRCGLLPDGPADTRPRHRCRTPVIPHDPGRIRRHHRRTADCRRLFTPFSALDAAPRHALSGRLVSAYADEASPPPNRPTCRPGRLVRVSSCRDSSGPVRRGSRAAHPGQAFASGKGIKGGESEQESHPPIRAAGTAPVRLPIHGNTSARLQPHLADESHFPGDYLRVGIRQTTGDHVRGSGLLAAGTETPLRNPYG